MRFPQRAAALAVVATSMLAGALHTATAQNTAPRPPQRQADSAATAPARAPGAYMNVSFVGLTVAGWSTEADVRSLQVGDHDPRVRGFTVPNAELVLDGTVDPRFRAVANIALKLDENGETGTELEEMFLITTSLPGNLQFKIGQFLAEFGRQNTQHPHAWGSADQPLALNRMFGSEGLRSQGARVSWLLPTPFYAEALLGVFNAKVGTAFSFLSDESGDIHSGVPVERDVNSVGDLLYVPRLASSFDLTDNQTLLLGASGAFGPNSGGETSRTSILGADVFWKWKSPRAQQGFPFLSVQAEYLNRDYATTNTPRIRDDGAYVQALWGIRPRLVAGLRSDMSNAGRVDFVALARQDRTRWSPSLTWYPSEFSKMRVQYNYDDRNVGGGFKKDHSVWLQFEFLLGAHAAHKF